ncbi:uncharacterized protein [Ptychodera flava]|uniref:uncharacterized protein n=1 Tax=Ptychodera flava TaxID=63121 RepID=UPI00396A43E6
MFSKIASQLRKTNAYTLQDLMHTVRGSYTPAINTELLTEVYNVKQWIEPHIAGTFGGHSKPHNFRFRRVNGKVKMNYRKWSTLPWKPVRKNDAEDSDDEMNEADESDGLVCLKTIPSLDEIPEWVIPSLEKLDVDAVRKHVPNSYGHRLPDYAKASWRDFFDNIKKYEQVPEEASTWPLKEIVDYCNNRRKSPPEVNVTGQTEERVEKLAAIIEEDNTHVTIGKQGKRQPRHVETVVDFSSLAAGSFVAVYCPDYTEVPQIGKVVSRDEETFNIHWYSGKWDSVWSPCYVTQGRKKQPWVDQQVLASAILWDFNLTAGRKLKAKIKNILKAKYASLVVQ